MSTALSLRGVSCHYGRLAKGKGPFWALKDLTFDVPLGASLGIVGNNGAGKSTLLSLLAGILEPDLGEIDRGGRTATLLSLNAGLDPDLSGRDNAMLSGLLLGLTRRRIRQELEQIKEFSGLKDFFERPCRTYSTGMRARLGFAVSVYLEPDILLIDEVIGVGDLEFKRRSEAVIRERMASSQTVIVVSHSLPFLRTTCDQAIWLDGGKLKQIGACDPVLDAYREANTPAEAAPA